MRDRRSHNPKSRDCRTCATPAAGHDVIGERSAERSEARAWLRDNGHKVGVRGRISAELMALFRDR